MMVVIGDKEVFATAHQLVTDGGRGPTECHFCYWVGGREIGNFSFFAPLEEIIEDIRHVLVDEKFRRNDKLFDLAPNQRIELIEAHLSGCDLTEDRFDEFRWSAYSVGYNMSHGYPLDVGVRWFVFYTEGPVGGKIVCLNLDCEGIFFETNVLSGLVDVVLKKTWDMMILYD